MMRLVLGLLLSLSSGLAASSEPPVDEYQFILPTAYGWDMQYHEGERTLRVFHTPDRRLVARYDISDCLFCSGEDDNCDMDGVFGLGVSSVDRPLLTVACHVGAHSQRFSIYDPLNDAIKPVFKVTGRYAIHLSLDEHGVEVSYDRDEDHPEEQMVWPVGYQRSSVSPREPLVFKPSLELTTARARLHQRLLAIVSARDSDALLALVSDDVAIEIGGAVRFRGKSHFIDGWSGDAQGGIPRQSDIWPLLEQLVGLGQDGRGPTLIYPFMARDWEQRGQGAVRVSILDDAPIYAGPYRSAPVLTRIGREALWPADGALNGFQEMEGWSAVRTAAGIYGFISHDDSLVPDDNVFMFGISRGRWILNRSVTREH